MIKLIRIFRLPDVLILMDRGSRAANVVTFNYSVPSLSSNLISNPDRLGCNFYTAKLDSGWRARALYLIDRRAKSTPQTVAKLTEYSSAVNRIIDFLRVVQVSPKERIASSLNRG